MFNSACSVTKSCSTLCDPMDYSPPGSSVHGIFQARILQWVAISSSRDLPDPGMQLASPIVACRLFTSEPLVTIKPCLIVQFSSVQSLSRVRLFATPWTEACQAFLSITNSRRLQKLMSIESVMPSNHLILCRPLLLLPSIFPSIRVFSNESVLCIRCPKYWSFSISISPSNEYSGWISFRMDWLDLLAVQGTLRSLLQHHSSKASILKHSAFLTANSHIYTWLLKKP